MSRIDEVTANGIKFSVPWVGEGTRENPYTPQVFGHWPDAYYHLVTAESDDPDTADARAVCWVDPEHSPGAAVDGIAAGDSPVFEVLQDNR